MTSSIDPSSSSYGTPGQSSPTSPSSSSNKTPGQGSFASSPPPALASAGPNSMDPTGVWAKFLSSPGHPATPKDIQMFIQGLLKSFNVLIQQSDAAAKRASDQIKQSLN